MPTNPLGIWKTRNLPLACDGPTPSDRFSGGTDVDGPNAMFWSSQDLQSSVPLAAY